MEIAITSFVALILVCITAYFIMTKDTRLKERELKMLEAEKQAERKLKEKELKLQEEAQDYEHELKIKALEHEQKLKEDAIEREVGCQHEYKLYKELVSKNDKGSIKGFVNVSKCSICSKLKQDSISV